MQKIKITKKLSKKELDKIIKDEIDRLMLEKQERGTIFIEDVEGNIVDYEDTDEAREFRAQQAREEAIKGFQRYYRTLSTNQRYQLVKWLKRMLLNELNLTEIEEIVSRVVSSSDGLKNRKDPLTKPK